MRESCTSGSVRGASSDRRLYSTLSLPKGRGMLSALRSAAAFPAASLQNSGPNGICWSALSCEDALDAGTCHESETPKILLVNQRKPTDNQGTVATTMTAISSANM